MPCKSAQGIKRGAAASLRGHGAVLVPIPIPIPAGLRRRSRGCAPQRLPSRGSWGAPAAVLGQGCRSCSLSHFWRPALPCQSRSCEHLTSSVTMLSLWRFVFRHHRPEMHFIIFGVKIQRVFFFFLLLIKYLCICFQKQMISISIH